MALKLVSDVFNTASISVVCANNFTGAKGTLVMADRSANTVIAATASSTTNNLFGVIQKTVVSGEVLVEVIPIIAGPGQIWEADMTNDTHATNQLLEAMVIGANAGVINNTGTTVTINTGVFTLLRNVGVVTDKKGQGYFNVMGQINAAS